MEGQRQLSYELYSVHVFATSAFATDDMLMRTGVKVTARRPTGGKSSGGNGTYLLCLLFSCLVMSDSLQPYGLSLPDSSLCPWDFPGENTAVGCYFLLQESS